MEACFSPGVDNRFAFENELAEKHGIPSFLCDGSIGDLDTGSRLLSFSKKWLTAHSDALSQTLDEWIAASGQANSRNLILQMDIEGCEYLVLQAVSYTSLARFRIIVIELHGLQDLGQSRFLNLRFFPVLKKLRESHDVVHVHPNNACGSSKLQDGIDVPNVVELTLYRRDENVANEMVDPVLPHQLDIYNCTGQPMLTPGFPLNILPPQGTS